MEDNLITEVGTFKTDVKELKREVLIDNDTFKKVVIKYFWDAHGKEIPWETEDGKQADTFTNAEVKLERITKLYHFEYIDDQTFTFMQATINGKKINGDVVSCKGNVDRLTIKACIGAG